MKNTNKLITLLTQKEFKELRSNFDVNNERSTQGENVKAFEPVVKFFVTPQVVKKDLSKFC